MKKFGINLTIVIALFFVSSELVIRICNLTSSIIHKTKRDGFTIYTPGQSGTNVFGNFGDIRAVFRINNQGYNSSIDYDDLFEGRKFAIVGDSYIEGFHEDIDSSIGRRIENILTGIQCHEYGRSGWNAYNYLQLSDKISSHYDKLLIVCDSSDFLYDAPEHHTINNSKIRSMIKKLRLINYLFFNRRISSLFQRKIDNFSKEVNNSNVDHLKRISSFQDKFPDNVVWVWRNGIEAQLTKENNIIVNQHLRPYNFGLLDSHWNSKGRQNCATTIADYVLSEN